MGVYEAVTQNWAGGGGGEGMSGAGEFCAKYV